ncbi:monovalent cation/H(+) antiporter subunit G [Nitrolancea hollandica]|uniref:Na+/H+ antiporter subunit G n=1 Tax=Nitrolancea hollandica Lb TaxID=1129897 RepID=I4EJ76_9BACT|nr:monovalent cation/H(+) antiporter subunit G [Nitrolancea hollandica]CCF84738.1 Na+/H+ antiporter subunit G [Nitrolancea hollandica Lb]
MVAMLLPWLADALVLVGLVILTLALWGVLRMPDLYTSLHAASKAAALGLAPILIAAGIDNRTILLRGLLVLGFLLLTTPVSSHAIARGYWRRHSKAAWQPSSESLRGSGTASAADDRIGGTQ